MGVDQRFLRIYVMCLFKTLCYMILLIPATITLSLEEGQPFNNTEAQRYYDLAISYIKSDLYEDGLKTLNQVAFLYPDSDVADDALYQLALIREQVGDGKLNIGEKKSIDTVSEELARLEETSKISSPGSKWASLADFLTPIANYTKANAKGQRVLEEYKLQTITQYILALDYLNTLTQRYPNSDRLEDTENVANRVIKKINAMIPESQKAKEKESFNKVGCLVMGGIVTAVLLLILIASIPSPL